MNYPDNISPTDPSAPWNAEGWTREQEDLVDELKKTLRAIDDLEDEQDKLYEKVSELREQIWNTGLDPDDALAVAY